MLFYVGLVMQLIGFVLVGRCLLAGLIKGDYGQLELVELVGGSLIFYLGTFVKNRGASK